MEVRGANSIHNKIQKLSFTFPVKQNNILLEYQNVSSGKTSLFYNINYKDTTEH